MSYVIDGNSVYLNDSPSSFSSSVSLNINPSYRLKRGSVHRSLAITNSYVFQRCVVLNSAVLLAKWWKRNYYYTITFFFFLQKETKINFLRIKYEILADTYLFRDDILLNTMTFIRLLVFFRAKLLTRSQIRFY